MTTTFHRRRESPAGRARRGARVTITGLCLGLAALAFAAAPALAQAPGVPRGYDYRVIDSGSPVAGTSFGWGVSSADLTGDGKADLLVAQGQGDPTYVFAYDGLSGELLHSITPPEANFDGSDPVLGFVYVDAMPDIGSCAGGDGGDSDSICDDVAVGAGDGIPEVLVGARELQVDVDPVDGDLATRGAGDPKIGRGYVIDGAAVGDGRTVVLKRIDMPVADRRLTNSLGGGATQFARVMVSLQGLPPCDGPVAELNSLGVGECPGELNDADPIYPRAVRIGDVTGGGQPDILITARNFRESIANSGEVQSVKVDAAAGNFTLSFNGNATGNLAFNASAAAVDAALEGLPGVGAGQVAVTGGPGGPGGTTPYVVTFTGSLATSNVAELAAADVDLSGGGGSISVTTIRQGGSSATAGSQCAIATSGTCTAGKAWVYRGEDIAGSDPSEILDTVAHATKNPFPQTTSGTEFGGITWRLGDISNPPDGRPDFVVAARNTSYPLVSPDTNLQPAIGVAYLFNGASGALITTYPHPEPQARSTFSASFNSGRPAGDLGLTGLPDVVVSAPLQNNSLADDGTAYVFRGDQASGGGGGQGGWQFAQMDDPNPLVGGGFGSSTTGVGNLVDGVTAAANEMLIGSWGPFDPGTEAAFNAVGDVHIINPQFGRNLQTIPDPTGERGSGFGVGMTPMGDLNDDGFLDFGVTAYLSDAPPGGLAGQGRAYILYSNDIAPPTPPDELKSGRCANERSGTEGDDVITGTLEGDTLFALGGSDRVSSLDADDCVDGGAGNDRLDGGAGKDSVLGGGGDDRLAGGPGSDRLFGMKGRDKLIGGKGRDLLDGGGQKDILKARGGGKDRVICGGGFDVAKVDAKDKVAANCERAIVK